MNTQDTIKCESTNVRVLRTAQEFPGRLKAIHKDKIEIRETAIYSGNGSRPGASIDVRCRLCGHEWSPRALNLLKGHGCPKCKQLETVASAGKRRCHRSSQEEKQRAIELKSQGWSNREIAKELNRSNSTICYWLNPDAKKKINQHSQTWKEQNLERYLAGQRSYAKDYEHGRLKVRETNARRRLSRTNSPLVVFLDGEWHEVDRKETYRVFKDELCPLMERVHIKQLYLEAQQLTEETGVEMHVDHIHPLSKGGEHLMVNLQLLPAEENLSKGNNFRIEDQQELCRRLFNPTHIQK